MPVIFKISNIVTSRKKQTIKRHIDSLMKLLSCKVGFIISWIIHAWNEVNHFSPHIYVESQQNNVLRLIFKKVTLMLFFYFQLQFVGRPYMRKNLQRRQTNFAGFFVCSFPNFYTAPFAWKGRRRLRQEFALFPRQFIWFCIFY